MQILYRNKTIVYHFLFWLVYILLGNLSELVNDPENYHFGLADVIFSNLPNVCTFYISVLILNKYSNPLKIFNLGIGIISAYIFTFIQWYFTGYHIRPLITASGAPTPIFNFWQHAVSVLWVFIKYFFWACGYHYAIENVKYQKKLRLIEKEKHEAEYAFLRAQINPHFLNNTLNFFFAKSLPLSNELADGIMTLSEIMRYSLNIDQDDRMTLIDEEIEHIKNVIKINQLRFNHKLQIDFNVNGDTNQVRMIPLILITVVENILKHGNCTDQGYPVKILLNVNADDGYIYLNTFNRKKNGPKELSSGIGMDNIEKRLSLQYEKDFELSIIETEDEYRLQLSLPYNRVLTYEEKNSFASSGFFLQSRIQPIKPKPYTS